MSRLVARIARSEPIRIGLSEFIGYATLTWLSVRARLPWMLSCAIFANLAEIHAVSLDRNALGSKALNLPGTHRNRSIGTNDSVPRNLLSGRREDSPD